MGEYIEASLTKLNELNDKRELFYKEPVTKEQAISMLREYAQDFPLLYDRDSETFSHGENGLAELCNACQLGYSYVMLNSRKIPYEIDKGADSDSVQTAVREIILAECDSVEGTDDNYTMFLHACVLYAVISAYHKYVNSKLPKSKNNGLNRKLGFTRKFGDISRTPVIKEV